MTQHDVQKILANGNSSSTEQGIPVTFQQRNKEPVRAFIAPHDLVTFSKIRHGTANLKIGVPRRGGRLHTAEVPVTQIVTLKVRRVAELAA